jgi:arginyl-tRNA synthetase
MNETLRAALLQIYPDAEFEITSPSLEHGDLTTNIALTLAKSEGVPPRELATKIIEKLRTNSELSYMFENTR